MLLNIKIVYILFSNLIFIILLSSHTIYSQGVHQCVHVTTKLAKYGDGSTPGSCMGCDPAVPECDPLCKPIIQKLYAQCNGICLPDGFFFDPMGCWDDNVKEINIQIGRCGCSNSSLKIYYVNISLLLLIIVATFFSLN